MEIFNYKEAKSIECSNNQFGDPVPGNIGKKCSYLQVVPKVNWIPCADDGQICTLLGTQMFRYGNNGIYTWSEFKNSVNCQISVLGNPSSGSVNKCESTNAEY